jgi:hypothetical protein
VCAALTNIILFLVGIDEPQRRRVGGIEEAALDGLVHGRDTGSARNHDEVRRKSAAVHKLAAGPARQHRVPDGKAVQVRCEHAIGVLFHDEVKVPTLVVERDGRVCPHDAFAVDDRCEGHVLAHAEAEAVVVVQSEAIPTPIRVSQRNTMHTRPAHHRSRTSRYCSIA